ncbi:MAG TPA: glucosyl-3-phosphoglycerate synthase [Actinomycetota bacterium]
MIAERWFARRTFHHSRFDDVEGLVEAKERQEISISACIPTLNEAETIGPIVSGIHRELIERLPLLDELVVMDSASEDGTARIAEEEGATVVQDAEVLSGLEQASGKGEALWKSLFVLKGDLIVWLDADIQNFHPRFVYGPLGPLLADPEIAYTKAFYDRPIKVGDHLQLAEGGRVTELAARPLLNMFWPELAAVVQPLSGEYAGRRSILEQLPFFTGYGVEIGLLIDIAARYGVDSIAQVDLDVRVHRNQDIAALSRMAFAVLQAAMRRLEAAGRITLSEELGTSYLQLQGTTEHILERRELRLAERPPAVTIPGYASR